MTMNQDREDWGQAKLEEEVSEFSLGHVIVAGWFFQSSSWLGLIYMPNCWLQGGSLLGCG